MTRTKLSNNYSQNEDLLQQMEKQKRELQLDFSRRQEDMARKYAEDMAKSHDALRREFQLQLDKMRTVNAHSNQPQSFSSKLTQLRAQRGPGGSLGASPDPGGSARSGAMFPPRQGGGYSASAGTPGPGQGG